MRSYHAAACIEHGGDRPQLVITGGRDPGDKVLNEVWIMYVQSGRWKKVVTYLGYLLFITRKMVPITGRARSFLLVFKNKIERKGRQNKNNRPINLPNVITFSTDFKYTTQSPNHYHTQ